MSSTTDAGKTNEQEPELKTSETAKNSIRRWNMRSTMAIQLIAAAVLLIGINIVAFNYGQQHDLTKDKTVELTPQTIANLESEAIQNREQSIKITAVINPYEFGTLMIDAQENIVERVQVRLRSYADSSNGKIELEFINPLTNTGRLQELSEQYGQAFSKSVLIVDARDSETPTAEVLQQLKERFPQSQETELIRQFKSQNIGKHVRFVPVSELFVSDLDRSYANKAYVSLWKDEAEITTNLMSAIEGRPKKIYFLYDKCQIKSKKGGKAPWECLKDILQGQNVLLENLSLSRLPTKIINGKSVRAIPSDADGIALISPQVDFTTEELISLQEYWERRDGSSFLITLDPEVDLPLLYNYLLSSSQIKPNKDRIIRKDGNQILVKPEVEFLQGPQVNGTLAGKSTTFAGASQSIKIRKINNNSGVEAFPIIQASPSWWGETQFGESDSPSFDHRADSPNPLYLGVAVTRGALNDPLTKHLVSKMVIIGNSEFLSQDLIRDEQTAFVSQTGSWLVGREPLMSLPQPTNIRRKVFIAAAHRDLINKIFLFFLPVAALLITGFVWNSRRS